MAKGEVPTRDDLLAFIRESATPIGKREIARTWGLKGDQRIALKEMLRELRDVGEIAAERGKTFRAPDALADVAVLEIVRESCQARTQIVNPMPPIMEPGEFFMPYPLEVEVGGATVFVLPVERFERL